MAHILPGKEGSTRPIICRLHSRIYKNLFMENKKEYALRETAAAGAAARAGWPPPFKYPVFEDLTRDAFVKMKELAGDDRVLACWSTGGQLRYRRKDDPSVVHKVRSIYDSVDNILG